VTLGRIIDEITVCRWPALQYGDVGAVITDIVVSKKSVRIQYQCPATALLLVSGWLALKIGMKKAQCSLYG